MRNLTIVIIIALMATLVAMAAIVVAQTNPPSGSDWIVEDNTFWDNDLTMTANITVSNGGALKLDNMTLTMTSSIDGLLTIFVEAGSSLELVNVNLKASDADAHYWFEAQGKLVIIDSDVQDVASNGFKWNAWDDIAGGVQIYDSNSRLIDSKFHHSQRINVYVSGASPEITGCEFSNAEYMNTYNVYQYSYYYGYQYIYAWYVDATGLFLKNSESNITDCVFSNNGQRSTANQFYTTSYYLNGVMTFGRGMLAYDSSPNITACDFLTNGDQPADRSVSSVQQIFFEQFFYDDVPEGGLVCVGSTSHPVVLDSLFENNDLFGIYGTEGGYPALVDRCELSGNRYIRENSIFSPSGGIYVATGGGTMTVANTTARGNYVLANIWVQETSLHLINFTNTNNLVTNAYNVYVGDGNHRIEDSLLDGRPSMGMNLYVSYGRNQPPKVRILDSELVGGNYGIYVTNYNGAYIYIANSTIRNNDQATFYLQNTAVDCVNCSLPGLRIDGYPYSGGSTVRIMYFVDIEVTWQNLIPIPGAFIQVFNKTEGFVYGGIADENGTIGPLTLTSKTYFITRSSQSEVSNTPLYIKAYSAGLESSRKGKEFVFITNLDARIIIEDNVEPTIYVFTPVAGHAQKTTTLEVRGMCTDVGAGINRTEVSLDQENWILAGGQEQTWAAILELTEGVHTIYFRAWDEAGNDKEEWIENVEIDLTPPDLQVLDPVKETWFTKEENYTIRGRVHGQVSLIINRQDVVVQPDGTWETTQDIHSGSNEFLLQATDHVGNTMEIIKSIVRDSTVPKLILTSPEADIWTNISQVEVKGITELGAIIRVNGEPIATFDGRFANTIYLTEGLNQVIVEAVDKANNVQRVIRNVHLDSIPPLLRVETPQGDILTSQRYLAIKGTIDDPTVEVVIINGLLVEVVDQAFSKDFRLDEGDNPISIEAWDNARNYASRSYLITLDTTAPQLELEEPDLYLETRDATVRIRGRVEADVDLEMWGEPQHASFDTIYLVRLENTFRYEEYPLVRGLNTIHILARDSVGNTEEIVIQVDHDLELPVMTLRPTAERTPNEIVVVSGILTDGSEVRINGIPVVLGLSGEFTEAVHLQKGKNEIRAVAFDIAGNSATQVINVTRYTEEQEPVGIMDAGMGLSIALLIGMLAIGLAVIYPGIRNRTARSDDEDDIIETEGPIHTTPAWGSGHGIPPIPPEPIEPEAPEPEPETQPEPVPTRRPLPPPPPDWQGGQGQVPEQASEQAPEPGVPPKPPWR
jgi:hypothetical protein